ncbi:MAG: hypothetical protein ACW981_17600 [Candidatus Hodarchaeales archaeon]|jgi:hypothetical protein
MKTLFSFLNTVSPKEIILSKLRTLKQSSRQANFTDVYNQIIQLEKNLISQFGSIPSYAKPLIDFKADIEKKLKTINNKAFLSLSLENFKILVKFIKTLSLLDEYKLLLGLSNNSIIFTLNIIWLRVLY